LAKRLENKIVAQPATHLPTYLLGGLLSLFLFSSVSMTRQSNSIEAAQTAIKRVESMPLATQLAPQEIDAAYALLREAEALAQRHASGGAVIDAARRAKNYAQTAQYKIVEAQVKNAAAPVKMIASKT
jgi:hypothetical protein